MAKRLAEIEPSVRVVVCSWLSSDDPHRMQSIKRGKTLYVSPAARFKLEMGEVVDCLQVPDSFPVVPTNIEVGSPAADQRDWKLYYDLLGKG